MGIGKEDHSVDTFPNLCMCAMYIICTPCLHKKDPGSPVIKCPEIRVFLTTSSPKTCLIHPDDLLLVALGGHSLLLRMAPHGQPGDI